MSIKSINSLRFIHVNNTVTEPTRSETTTSTIFSSLANNAINKNNVENCHLWMFLLQDMTSFLCSVSCMSRLPCHFVRCRFKCGHRMQCKNDFLLFLCSLILLCLRFALKVYHGDVHLHEAGGLNSLSFCWKIFLFQHGGEPGHQMDCFACCWDLWCY